MAKEDWGKRRSCRDIHADIRRTMTASRPWNSTIATAISSQTSYCSFCLPSSNRQTGPSRSRCCPCHPHLSWQKCESTWDSTPAIFCRARSSKAVLPPEPPKKHLLHPCKWVFFCCMFSSLRAYHSRRNKDGKGIVSYFANQKGEQDHGGKSERNSIEFAGGNCIVG